jgi:hypothetical protein
MASQEVSLMILFTLRCAQEHEFEGWFPDNKRFETQHADGEIACPHCGDTSVEKAVMAPRLGRSRGAMPPAAALAQLRKVLIEMRRQVETHCDYVGTRFADEARRIHYGETDAHAIYGETSDAESRELVDEGISFGQLPWIPTSDA